MTQFGHIENPTPLQTRTMNSISDLGSVIDSLKEKQKIISERIADRRGDPNAPSEISEEERNQLLALVGKVPGVIREANTVCRKIEFEKMRNTIRETPERSTTQPLLNLTDALEDLSDKLS